MPEIKLNLPELPAGWEYTGEFRSPQKGEYLLAHARVVKGASFSFKADLQLMVRRNRWKPSKGETFWYVRRDFSGVDSTPFDITYSEDYNKSSCGNCFQTKEQAEWAVDRCKAILEEAHKKV